MASPRIKATYALDEETVRALERTARRLNVSKSEALRRAIRAMDAESSTHEYEGALDALDQLQDRVRLSAAAASAWRTRARRERSASSARREPPSGR